MDSETELVTQIDKDFIQSEDSISNYQNMIKHHLAFPKNVNNKDNKFQDQLKVLNNKIENLYQKRIKECQIKDKTHEDIEKLKLDDEEQLLDVLSRQKEEKIITFQKEIKELSDTIKTCGPTIDLRNIKIHSIQYYQIEALKDQEDLNQEVDLAFYDYSHDFILLERKIFNSITIVDTVQDDWFYVCLAELPLVDFLKDTFFENRFQLENYFQTNLKISDDDMDDLNMYQFADERKDEDERNQVYNFSMYTSVFNHEELRRMNSSNTIQNIAKKYNVLKSNQELLQNIQNFMLEINKIVNEQQNDVSGLGNRNQFQFLNFQFDLRQSKLTTSEAVQLLALLLQGRKGSKLVILVDILNVNLLSFLSVVFPVFDEYKFVSPQVYTSANLKLMQIIFDKQNLEQNLKVNKLFGQEQQVFQSQDSEEAQLFNKFINQMSASRGIKDIESNLRIELIERKLMFMHANLTQITFESKIVSFPKIENSILNYKKQKVNKIKPKKDVKKDINPKDNKNSRKNLLEELGIKAEDDQDDRDNENNPILRHNKDKERNNRDKDTASNKVIDDKYLQNIFVLTLKNIVLRRHSDQKLTNFEFQRHLKNKYERIYKQIEKRMLSNSNMPGYGSNIQNKNFLLVQAQEQEYLLSQSENVDKQMKNFFSENKKEMLSKKEIVNQQTLDQDQNQERQIKKFKIEEDQNKDAQNIIEDRIKYMENLSKQKRMNSIKEGRANKKLNNEQDDREYKKERSDGKKEYYEVLKEKRREKANNDHLNTNNPQSNGQFLFTNINKQKKV